jgi:hypothetical protein
MVKAASVLGDQAATLVVDAGGAGGLGIDAQAVAGAQHAHPDVLPAQALQILELQCGWREAYCETVRDGRVLAYCRVCTYNGPGPARCHATHNIHTSCSICLWVRVPTNILGGAGLPAFFAPGLGAAAG